jgi:hypothetical protein
MHAVQTVLTKPHPELGVLLFERLPGPLAVQVPEERDVRLGHRPERQLLQHRLLFEQQDRVCRGGEHRI